MSPAADTVERLEREALEAALPGDTLTLDPEPGPNDDEDERVSGRLQGRVALVAGGEAGLGRAVALLLAREGADLVILHAEAAGAEAAETVTAIEAEGRRCLLAPGEPSDADACGRAVEHAVHGLGRLDAVIDAAAVPDPAALGSPLTEHALGTVFGRAAPLAAAALPSLPHGACLIGTYPMADATEAVPPTLREAARALADGLVVRGIRVNLVAPVRPPHAPPGEEPPLRRPPGLDEIAPAYAFLASGTLAGSITGEVLAIAGGAWAEPDEEAPGE